MVEMVGYKEFRCSYCGTTKYSKNNLEQCPICGALMTEASVEKITAEQFKKWTAEKCNLVTDEVINNIDYKFCTLKADGWIGIFKRTGTDWCPLIVARDREHAIQYCEMREAPKFNVRKLC